MIVTVCNVRLDIPAYGTIPRVWEYERLREREALHIVEDRWLCRGALMRRAKQRGGEIVYVGGRS